MDEFWATTAALSSLTADHSPLGASSRAAVTDLSRCVPALEQMKVTMSAARARVLRSAPVAAAVAAVLVLLLLAAGGCRAAPPVPPQCVYTGLQFQITCSGELRNASLTLTGNATTDPGDVKVSMDKFREYLKTAPSPSLACCEAFSSFNNLYCLCAPDMIDEFKAWVDMNQLTETALWLEKRCPLISRPFTLYIEPKCPERPVYKPTPEEAAAERARGIVPIGNRTAGLLPTANQTAPAGANAAPPSTASGNASSTTNASTSVEEKKKKRRFL